MWHPTFSMPASRKVTVPSTGNDHQPRRSQKGKAR